NWQQYTIDVSQVNLRYVLAGFGWTATGMDNPNGAVFYLDNIQYQFTPEKQVQRIEQPHFLRSYATLPNQTPNGIDLVDRNAAFTSDNAQAILAFLADGTPTSLRRATSIADAFVYAATHDRTYTDGRLRNAYSAGDISLPP